MPSRSRTARPTSNGGGGRRTRRPPRTATTRPWPRRSWRSTREPCTTGWRGPHPVGVHLSGGLDSSSVAVLAARALRRAGRPAPLAFGWHPPPGRGPRSASQAAEYGPIEAVSRQEGLEVVYRPPSAADVVDYLRRDATRDPEIMDHEEPLRRCAAGARRTGAAVGMGRRRGRLVQRARLLSAVAARRSPAHALAGSAAAQPGGRSRASW